MSKCHYEAVWFDLDGTLFNTSDNIIPAIKAALTHFDYPIPEDEFLRRNINFGSRGVLARAIGCEKDDPKIEELHEVYSKHYINDLSSKSVWFDGIEAIVERLENEGTPWGVITNKIEYFTIPLVKQLGIDQRIAVLVCGDTVEESKPSAKPLLHACKQTGHDPQKCIYIGDNSTDIIAGRAAGMATVAAAYGFVPTGESAYDWGADAVVENPAELGNILWP